MKVIILAAGIGQRLGAEAQGRPKCLLEVGAASLLARHIRILQRCGLRNIYIVTGFKQALIAAALRPFALHERCIFNQDFHRGSGLSLHCARELLSSGEDILLMDADVFYEEQVLKTLVQSRHENCFLLDRDLVPGAEPVKLCVRNGRLVEFGKALPAGVEFDFCGESVGFFRFSAPMAGKLARHLQHYRDTAPDAPYEEALRDLLLEEPAAFAFEDITGLAWIEIDFPEDLAHARSEVLAKVRARENSSPKSSARPPVGPSPKPSPRPSPTP